MLSQVLLSFYQDQITNPKIAVDSPKSYLLTSFMAQIRSCLPLVYGLYGGIWACEGRSELKPQAVFVRFV